MFPRGPIRPVGRWLMLDHLLRACKAGELLLDAVRHRRRTQRLPRELARVQLFPVAAVVLELDRARTEQAEHLQPRLQDLVQLVEEARVAGAEGSALFRRLAATPERL